MNYPYTQEEVAWYYPLVYHELLTDTRTVCDRRYAYGSWDAYDKWHIGPKPVGAFLCKDCARLLGL